MGRIFLDQTLRHICLITVILLKWILNSVCCCSVAQLCPVLCSPMHCSTPVFHVLDHLPELAQTHVRWVIDAIQPSHPLSSPSPPAFSLSNERLGLIFFRIDWFDLLAVQGLSRVFSNITVQKHQFSLLSFLYSPTLTSIHDDWKNCSLD